MYYKPKSIVSKRAGHNRASQQRFLQDNRQQPTIQMKTTIHNQGQPYNFGAGSVLVGKKMESWLDPHDMKRGQSASVNSSQNEMMAKLRQDWGIKGGAVVKGHLLNDNLGGSALNNNLYPITRAANKDHLMYVENTVKAAVWDAKQQGVHDAGVHYTLEVQGVPRYDNPHASFKATVQQWDPKSGQHGKSHSVTIPSDLTKVSSYHQAFDPSSQDDLTTHSNPVKPSGFSGPKSRVSDLSDDERRVRDAQPVTSHIDGNTATHWDANNTSYSHNT